MESEGRKYVIDLRNQVVSEELASSDSDSDDSHNWKWGSQNGRKRMEPDDEGVLELEGYSEDETSSIIGLFHWQMEDYEVFHPDCHMLQICEIGESSDSTENATFSPEYEE